jgi:DNA-binding MarR family transcriptional regulator
MTDFDIHSLPLIGLLNRARDLVRDELNRELRSAGYEEIRDSHGCVFGNIAPEGSRLTELAERSGLTKQAVGEAVTDLEGLGYAERSPDPTDGRAKIIRLTGRGAETQAAGRAVLADIEARWAERYGAERVATLRELLGDVIADETAVAAPA